MKRAEIISDSFHHAEVVYNDDAHVVSETTIDTQRAADIYNVQTAARLAFMALRNVPDCGRTREGRAPRK